MSIESQAKQMIAPRLLVPVELGDVSAASLTPPRYVIRPIVPRGFVTLLGGHGGAGKSILGETLLAHVAAGAHTWAGLQVEDGNALFVSLEDPGALVRYRLRQIAEAYDLNAAKLGRRLKVVDGTEAAAALVSEYNDSGTRRLSPLPALEELAEAARGCSLIVVDNASDAFDANENDRRMVRGFLRLLTGIARETDAGVILLAHIDKSSAKFGSSGNSYSGSTAWHNSARSRLALVEDNGLIELRHEKLNLGRKAEPIALRWSDGGVLVPVHRSANNASSNDADGVLAAIRAASAAGADISAARTGPTTTQTVLSTFPELPAHLKGPKGRQAFWAAVSVLQAQRRVEVNEIRTASRHLRKVLVEVREFEPAHDPGARANPPHPLYAYSAHRGAGVCEGSRRLGELEHAQTCARCNGEGCHHCEASCAPAIRIDRDSKAFEDTE